jgi:hypothetical protein
VGLALVAGGVESVVGRVETEQGLAEGVGAVRGQLADDAIGGVLDERPRRAADGQQREQTGVSEQHREAARQGRGPLPGGEEAPAKCEEERRDDRRQGDEDLAGRIALPDIGDHFGRIEEVVDGDEVETAVELLEEEPLRCGDEKAPVQSRDEAERERRLLPSSLPPALGQEREVEHQGQDAPGGDPEVEHGAGGEDARQGRDRMRHLAASGQHQGQPRQRAEDQEEEPETEGEPESGAQDGADQT